MLFDKKSKPTNTRLWVMIAIIAVFAVFQTTFAATGLNKQINYQAKLTNNLGVSVPNGNYDIVFKIYDAATAGTTLWTGTYTAANSNPITVTNGVFNVLLGSGTGNTLALDFSTDSYYLGVKVGADAEMTPRKRLGSTPQAFNANNLIGDGFIKLTGTPTGNNVDQGTIYINPTTATSGYTLLGLAVNGAQKFKVDEAGNSTQAGTLTVSGTGNSTFAGNVGISGILYDSSADAGISGQILSSTATGTNWINAPSNMVIGGTINGATAGSILFAGTAGVLTQDNANFFWDDTNNRLGIGTASPGGMLDIIKTHASGTTQEMFRAAFDANWGFRLVQNYVGAGDIKYEMKEKYNGTEYDVLAFKSGNVGIGTTGPGARLDVSGGSIRTTNQLISTVAIGTAPLAVSSTTLNTSLNADMVDGLHSTSFYAASNPSGYITSSGRAYPRRSDGADLNFYWSGQGGQPTWLWGGEDGANMYVYNPSNFVVNNISTPTSSYKHIGAWGVGRTAVGAILVNTAYMADQASYTNTAGLYYQGGAVGIGTASPSDQLTIFKSDGAGDASMIIGNDTSNKFGRLAYSDGSDFFSIQGGSWGGTTRPLVLQGGGGIVGIGMFNGDTNIRALVAGRGTTSATWGLVVRDSGGVTNNFFIRDDGYGYLRAAAWAYGSDRRLKENITNLNYGLDTILALNPQKFDYISGVKNQLGFIAQEVQPIIPELVSTSEDGMLALQTDMLIPIMVNAMKEQQTQILGIANNQTAITTNLDELTLKTDQNITTLQQLQASIDTQLGVVQTSLTNLTMADTQQKDRLTALETTTAQHTTRITDLENLTLALQSQIQTLQNLSNPELDLAQITLNTEDISSLKTLLGINPDKPGDVSLAGKLTAETLETGLLTVKVVDEESTTIGTATISNGETSVVVPTTAVSADSKIFVTVRKADEAVPVKVGTIVAGESFEIEISKILVSPTELDWWIIEAK
ncbi:MAG: tail fiber domain-containing protein [Parcubacteria group bacterium]|jgi:hypothetical protein